MKRILRMKKINLSVLAVLMTMGGLLAQVSLDGNRLKPSGAVRFQAGVEQLSAESIPFLQEIADYLKSKPYITLMRIEGHVAAGEQDARAQQLSEQRAMAIANWLIQAGIECGRLLPVGFGTTKPVMSNQSPEGRSSNTRMEFHIASLRGRLIGGMPADGGGRAQSVCN